MHQMFWERNNYTNTTWMQIIPRFFLTCILKSHNNNIKRIITTTTKRNKNERKKKNKPNM